VRHGGVRLVLLPSAAACATAPIRAVDAERVESAQAGDDAIPGGVAYGGGAPASGGFDGSHPLHAALGPPRFIGGGFPR